MRWTVVIARRDMDPDSGTGITETFVEIARMRADVQPSGPMTFYGSAQIDTPVTHRITMRWLDGLDTTCVVLRDTRRPDNTVRREIFRVRRVAEYEGRKRFVLIDAELEHRE